MVLDSRCAGILLVITCFHLSPFCRAQVVDASTLTDKTVVGYQGWFMAPGDGNPASVGWRHWSSESGDAPGGTDIGPGLYTVEMWPDLGEYDPDELFDAPNVTFLDDSSGKLFSSLTLKTVQRHFQWMKEHGIDGAFLQRFVGELSDSRFFNNRNSVLENVQAGANTHGRVFAIEYDTSGVVPAQMFQAITDDWKFLVDTYDIINDPRYLYHNGKPVVTIWGLGFSGRGHTPALASQIIDFFKNDTTYGGNLVIGGVPTFWRTLTGDSETDRRLGSGVPKLGHPQSLDGRPLCRRSRCEFLQIGDLGWRPY